MHVRRPLMAVTGLALAALLAGCAGDDLAEDNDDPTTSGSGSGGSGEGTSVVIGSQSFDEAALVTAMYQEVLEAEGYEVETRLVDTRPVYLNEMPDAVQIAPEYVAGIVDQLNTDANGPDAEPLSTSDAQETIDAGATLLEEKGITLLEPSEAFSANGYFASQEFSDAEGVTKLSDLEGQAVTLAAAPDCKGRTDCEKGLVDTYGIDITLEPLGYASTETFQAVLDGEAQIGQTSTLDGTLEDQGLLLLEDDKGIQPAQNLVPAVSSEFLADHPDVEGTLNDLMAALDNETLGQLLVQVQIDREEPAAVAQEFLESEGLL
ncbi:glycine betaine ABC transporter substrate-binding protein [Nocardioides renjunii]|uniref:glycine betaine ABC transporter substrate-binding protein n=1 Tax=Nocardioides renjunii TaxID=3095075 RepID=UPI002AFECEE2|nr:glycine betaine ABC transporter substrate-binding protein [Nocardioides sp. S-34]WQQ22838.1 glycine betaine ABC transporter substrate-binding protein [Nocardioides sp. S-34]